MKRFKSWCTAIAVCSAAGVALGRSPIPIDPPTPPPCAADGTCYPRSGEWGYYPVRWRTWPGADLTPTPSGAAPTPADGRVSPELDNSETPPAELEDAAAPPGSPRRDEPSAGVRENQPASPAGPGQSAPSQEGGGMPSVPLPDDENAPLGLPTSDNDPPPALPFSTSAPRGLSGNRQVGATVSRPASSLRVSTNDEPPTPPWAQSASL